MIPEQSNASMLRQYTQPRVQCIQFPRSYDIAYRGRGLYPNVTPS